MIMCTSRHTDKHTYVQCSMSRYKKKYLRIYSDVLIILRFLAESPIYKVHNSRSFMVYRDMNFKDYGKVTNSDLYATKICLCCSLLS